MNNMSKPIERVISLGTLCLTATLLQSMGLKVESYPFDWIFSTPVMVAHCLKDDFSTFLDKSQYVRDLNSDEPRCYHSFYNSFEGMGGRMFNHHDPTSDDGYAYFERCVARFRKAILAPNNLFVLVQEGGPGDKMQFETLAMAFRRHAPDVEMRYLAFHQDATRAGTVNVVATDGKCVLLEVSTCTLLNYGVKFFNPSDDELLRRIIRENAGLPIG